MQTSELLAYIFGDPALSLAAACGRWMAESPRFRAFAETYRDKIRKKARGLRDEEGRRDLLFELATAYRLLQERHFTIEYEKYGVGKQRGPDFAVTYRTNLLFNVEVKRMRPSEAEDGREANKLGNAVCAKLGQLPPGAINLLALGAAGATYTEDDIALAIRQLKQLADRKEEGFFVRRGFADARDFLRQYQRLSGALLQDDESDGAASALWINKEARHPLPANVYAILRRHNG